MDIKDNKKLGIACIIGSAFFFAFMSIFIRLSGDLPTFQKMFFRNMVALLVSFFWVKKSKEGFIIERKARKFVFFRAIFGSLGIFTYFYAIDKMNISDANILQKLSPFFGIIASYFILLEKPSKKDIIFTLIAFLGALFVIKPSFSILIIPSLSGVLAGFFSGIAYTLIRKASKNGAKGKQIIFYFSLFSSIFSLVMMFKGFVVMTRIQVIYLILAGSMAMLGQVCVTGAYSYAKAKELASFDYIQVVFSALLGYIFFVQVPDIYSIIGYIIIIGAVIIKSRMEKKSEERN